MDVLPASLIAQLRKGVLQFCVLGVLGAAERYSYEIVRELAALDGLLTSEGTLYPLLSRLRKEGMIVGTWRESPSGPPRRYYRVTPSGSAALSVFKTEWDRFSRSVDIALSAGGLT